MVEVTRHNFEDLLPQIQEEIENATFIGVDAEYTGIHGLKKSSLFDSASERYENTRDAASKFSACQFGLATFREGINSDVYYVTNAYNFYLFPVSFDTFGEKDLLTCQISSLNFLAKHDFNFNKFIKEGIPYLNKSQAKKLEIFLKDNRHMRTTDDFHPYCLPREKTIFDPSDLTNRDINDIINQLAGFSKVIDIIFASGKPVVGHNLLMDLMITHQLFYDDLPESFASFKLSALENVFPKIFDTKFLATRIRYQQRKDNYDERILWDTNLFSLYTKTFTAQLNFPMINTWEETAKYKELLEIGRTTNLETVPSNECHSAGFDAVVTGCVFINLCFMSTQSGNSKASAQKFPIFDEVLKAIEHWENKINISLASVPYINLVGSEPDSHRPAWLHVKRFDGKLIDAAQLKEDLLTYGHTDVESLNDREVIIACGGMTGHRNVLSYLKRNRKRWEIADTTERACPPRVDLDRSSDYYVIRIPKPNFGMKMLLVVGFIILTVSIALSMFSILFS